jgi:hypothetical protein
MRLQGSDLNMYNLFRKMHNQSVPNNTKIKSYVTNNKALYYRDVNTGLYYKIHDIFINGNTKTISFTKEVLTGGT